jgi:alpha-beta hydrolase superfamily lysophospholipase
MFIEKRNFKNSRGLNLSAIFEGEDRNASTVVICHGYGSSKDSIAQKDLRRNLVESGFSVFTFDFTGCGESQGTIRDQVPSNGLDDLKSAISNLGKKEFVLHGTSFGGYVALLYASQNPVLALTLKCPVSDYPEVLRLKDKEEASSRDKILKETVNINLYERVKNIKASVLIVHGDTDEVVPLDQSRKLLKSVGSKEKELKIIKGAPHTMRGKPMKKAHRQIVNFLKRILY